MSRAIRMPTPSTAVALLAIAATAVVLSRPSLGAGIEPTSATSRSARHTSANAAKPSAVAETAFRVTTSQPGLDPVLLQAYAALNAGELATAEAGYARVLQSDANNADALQGLAVAALRRGKFGDAEDFFRRAINAEPRNAIALAGLFGLRGHIDPAGTESRLKSLVAEQPWQHPLHFALGNVYAAAGRWSEAQRAFFRACDGAAEHPDYLFNLAVSLDHLHQPHLAAHYYGRAIAAATKHPAAFDTTQAAARQHALLH